MRHILQCRTAALGAHLDQCDACGQQRISFHSCRDRHCPKCQSIARHDWLEKRLATLLPIPYFHVVFTLPHELNALALGNQTLLLISCSLRSPGPCRKSPPLPGIWERKSVSLPCCTVGDKTSCSIPTYTVWSPVADCPRMASPGSQPERSSSCRSQSFARCFAASSWTPYAKLTTPASSS